MGLFDRFKKTSKESLLGYLKNSISDNSSLEHIVSVFEEMCNMPLKEVKNHYLFKFSETKKQKSDVVKKSWNLLLAGIFFVIVYILMSYFSKNSDNMSRNASLWLSIFSEVIDIVYWVFIWEAVDKFFFEQREVQRQLFRLTQLATADINFIAKGKWEEEKKKFHSIEEDNKEEAEID